MKSSVTEWLKPRDAVVLLSPLVGSDKAAKELLAERIKDGLLTTSARYMTEGVALGAIPRVFTDDYMSPEASPNLEVAALYRGFPELSETEMGSRFVYRESSRDLKRFIMLGGVCSFSHDWEKDLGRWDWSAGTLIFTQPPVVKGAGANKVPARFRFRRRMVVYGVEFEKAGVEEIVRSFGASSVRSAQLEKQPFLYELIPTGRPKGGMNKDASRWTNFWTEAAKLMTEGRLKNFDSQAELRKELIHNMGSQPFSDDAIKKPVREIWRVFVEPTRP